MDPEGSLLHSQLPSNCPYPKPTKTSPCPPIPLLEDTFKYYPHWGYKYIEFRHLGIVQPWCTLCYLFNREF